jgi:hypothetical protein
VKSLFSLIRAVRLQAACATTLVLGSCAVQALSVDDACHPLTRTDFCGAPPEMHGLPPLTREQAVDPLLDGLEAASRL